MGQPESYVLNAASVCPESFYSGFCEKSTDDRVTSSGVWFRVMRNRFAMAWSTRAGQSKSGVSILLMLRCGAKIWLIYKLTPFGNDISANTAAHHLPHTGRVLRLVRPCFTR